MKLNDIFETDKDAEENGKWFPMGPDTRIKLRSFTSTKSKESRRRLEQPYSAILRGGGKLPDDVMEDIAVKQIAEAIVVDWEGFQEDDDSEMVYSEAKCLSELKRLPKFRDFIAQIVVADDSYKIEQRAEAEGN